MFSKELRNSVKVNDNTDKKSKTKTKITNIVIKVLKYKIKYI